MTRIFHIGYIKSASTFLQKHVFPNIPEFEFINYSPENIKIARSEFPDFFDDYYDFETSKALKYFADIDKNCIYSCEGFSDKIEHITRYQKTSNNNDPEICISNLLKLVNKNDKIIIVLRRQDNLVESYYKRIPQYFFGEEEIFIDFPVKNLHAVSARVKKFTGSGMIYLRSFDYWHFISNIVNIVGKEKVFILLYEDLLHDPEKFFSGLSTVFDKDLSSFIDQSNLFTNAGPKVKQQLPNFLNKVFRNYTSSKILYKLCWKLFSKDRSSELSPLFKQELLRVYKFGNKRLDKYFSLNLSKYGYY